MAADRSRRQLLGAAGAAVGVGLAMSVKGVQAAGQSSGTALKILGICCSPRKGMTTFASLKACLEAAQGVNEKIETELVELAGLKMNGSMAAGVTLEAGERDDFPSLIPKLADPKVAGIIVGTPVYFGNMTSLCKEFLDRCIAFRKDNFALRNKVAGVLAVGGARNGGQELTIQSVQTALMCQEMIVVGDGQPTGHFGATVWSGGEGSVAEDDFGMATTKNLGRRVAEVALLAAGVGDRS